MGGAERLGQEPFPETLPQSLNHVVLTATVLGDLRQGRGPAGDPVMLLEVEFPVRHPERPRCLLTRATYGIEVPAVVARRGLDGVRRGAAVLVSGTLSERPALDACGTGSRSVILANLIHGAPPEEPSPSSACGSS